MSTRMDKRKGNGKYSFVKFKVRPAALSECRLCSHGKWQGVSPLHPGLTIDLLRGILQKRLEPYILSESIVTYCDSSSSGASFIAQAGLINAINAVAGVNRELSDVVAEASRDESSGWPGDKF